MSDFLFESALRQHFPTVFPISQVPFVLRCDLCEVQFNPADAAAHINGARHKTTVIQHPQKAQLGRYLSKDDTKGTYACTLCKTGPMTDINNHVKGRAHCDAVKLELERLLHANEAQPKSQPQQKPHAAKPKPADQPVVHKYPFFKSKFHPGMTYCASCKVEFPTSLLELRNHSGSIVHRANLPATHHKSIKTVTAKDIKSLCYENRPYLVHCPQDPLSAYCSLCYAYEEQIPMSSTELLDHLVSRMHVNALKMKAVNERSRPLSVKEWESGGYGQYPDAEVAAAYKDLERVKLGKHKVPPLINAYTWDLDDYPSKGQVFGAISRLTSFGISQISEISGGIVEPKVPKEAIEGNLFSLLAKKDTSVRDLMDLQLHLEETNANLELKRYNKHGIKLVKVGKNYRIDLPGVAENRPSVMRGDTVEIYSVSPHRAMQFYGFVHHVNVDNIMVSLSERFINHPNNKYSIVFTLPRTQYRKLLRAVEVCHPNSLLFLPSNVGSANFEPLQATHPGSTVAVASLNEQQKQFVEHVHGPTRLSVLWGPPGTGKTTALVAAIIDTIFRSPTSKLLVCAPSNEAADLIVERILRSDEIVKKGWKNILRIHGLSRNPKALPQGILDVSPKVDAKSGSFTFPSDGELTRHQIIVSTLMSADRLFSVGLSSAGFFTHLFVDEAGHATEQLLMVGLNAAGAELESCNTKIVLAGDPKQLGPLVPIPALALLGVSQSPLQRIQQDRQLWAEVGCQLLECYRSHPAIVNLINTSYADKLIAKVADKNKFAGFWDTELVRGYWDRHLRRGKSAHNATSTWTSRSTVATKGPSHGKVAPGQPILYLNHCFPEQQEADSPSWLNRFEVEKITEIVKTLFLSGQVTSPNDIAVITPYRKQVQCLTHSLRNMMASVPSLKQKLITKDAVTKELLRVPRLPLKVATVDSFQGRESKVVIVSCVRSSLQSAKGDKKFQIGFLNQPERANVALSRAKDLLIVVGNKEVLTHDPTWKRYCDRLDMMDEGVVLNIGDSSQQPQPIDVKMSSEEIGMEERGAYGRENFE